MCICVDFSSSFKSHFDLLILKLLIKWTSSHHLEFSVSGSSKVLLWHIHLTMMYGAQLSAAKSFKATIRERNNFCFCSCHTVWHWKLWWKRQLTQKSAPDKLLSLQDYEPVSKKNINGYSVSAKTKWFHHSLSSPVKYDCYTWHNMKIVKTLEF